MYIRETFSYMYHNMASVLMTHMASVLMTQLEGCIIWTINDVSDSLYK